MSVCHTLRSESGRLQMEPWCMQQLSQAEIFRIVVVETLLMLSTLPDRLFSKPLYACVCVSWHATKTIDRSPSNGNSRQPLPLGC